MSTTALLERDNVLPIDFETEIPALQVRGELPRELNGTLYRNGPNPQFPSADAHWFSGDGMLHAFAIADGKARYANRWVRTPKWTAERAAGHALFRGFGAKLDGAPGDSGVANTNIVAHAGRLFALEEAHPPTEIDPATLGTRGYCDFGGGIAGPFTAHPKTDPATGEMLFFGYNARGPFSNALSFGTIDRGGIVTRFETFETPYASMVHDFAITENYVLFPVLPLAGSMDRAAAGRPPYAWEPERAAWLGVLKRGAPVSQTRWLRSEACYVFHLMNAWEEGGRILADVMQYEQPPLFPHADGSRPDPAKSGARLCRWTVDLDQASDSFSRAYTDVMTGEFPRIDDRFAGRRNRHGWYACAGESGALGRLGGLVHADNKAGTRNVRLLGEGDTVSEPVFVPRRADAAEGDGWLLALAYRAAENRSDLQVYQATDIQSGPVATVEVPHRVPDGFHGNWVAAEDLSR